jgi:hypothetical protein
MFLLTSGFSPFDVNSSPDPRETISSNRSSVTCFKPVGSPLNQDSCQLSVVTPASGINNL